MPRDNRQYNQQINLYHIIIRGIDKQDIFNDDKDRNKFLEEISETQKKYGYQVCTYCLMDNHVHLVVYDVNQNISKAIQSLLIRYSMYFNKKQDRIGTLLQDRFLSRVITNKIYFLNVCRYVHQNPLKANISATEDYKWSSYQDFLNNKKDGIVNTKLLLNQFSKNNYKEAIEKFVEFHKKHEEILDGRDILDYEMNQTLTDEQLRKIILNILKIENIHDIKTKSNEERKKLLIQLKDIKTSCRQLSRVIGIDRKTVKKYCNL